jgi:hypothetical protein
MAAENPFASAMADGDDSAFVKDDSDVARIFSQVTGTTAPAELLERISGGAGQSKPES